MLRHISHIYIINFVKGLFPLASEAHRGYTSLHEYVITIRGPQALPKKGFFGCAC